MASPSERFSAPAPTPTATATPTADHRSRIKRRRVSYWEPESHPERRQIIADASQVANAEEQCLVFSGNDKVSCLPTADDIYPQHQYGTFVWNSRRPELTQTNRVNVYLFRADSGEQVLSKMNLENPSGQSGRTTAQVDDRWFGTDGEDWSGKNITYPFYWVITRNDTGLVNPTPQATFFAVQTTYADSVIASMSSTSAAGTTTSTSLASPSPSVPGSISPTGSVQGAKDNDKFPDWAIAVIVVLGFLAIAASCMLAFFIMRWMRRRREEIDSNRNSMGSASPMMQNMHNNDNQSPLLASGMGMAGGAAVARAPSVVSPDGASTISESGPFSGADAAIMAEAFRKALRKPDFAQRPVEEGESPEAAAQQQEENERKLMMNRELAEEGRDIRSVSSSRGVRVETLSDSGDTVLDH